MIADRLSIDPGVAAALAAGRPVVALESTLISHGLPYPQNLEVACAAEAAVSDGGGVAATVAIHAGRIRVGLGQADLEELARAPAGSVVKAARPNLAAALSVKGWAATTVSATMIAAAAAGIRVFATGGIGGVHRGAGATFDVSSDLDELARTPLVVVCAGPKSILDVPATLEYLETRGVPVVTIGQPDVPGFYARSSGVRSPWRVDDAASAAGLAEAHLGLGLGSGMLVCEPVPEGDALPEGQAREAVDRACADADDAGIGGPELTPWLLARIADLTSGAAVRANTALIVNNARVAAEIAGQLGRRS
ncbi:MAG TPA: pseudouridine-5'-phosphate glycosidase [Candidatus Limnocylindrales bacterium]|nr:pseudouridine-5'-phosphate glycosidase [Candidatus Limnocylindrales bacterium]